MTCKGGFRKKRRGAGRSGERRAASGEKEGEAEAASGERREKKGRREWREGVAGGWGANFAEFTRWFSDQAFRATRSLTPSFLATRRSLLAAYPHRSLLPRCDHRCKTGQRHILQLFPRNQPTPPTLNPLQQLLELLPVTFLLPKGLEL